MRRGRRRRECAGSVRSSLQNASWLARSGCCRRDCVPEPSRAVNRGIFACAIGPLGRTAPFMSPGVGRWPPPPPLLHYAVRPTDPISRWRACFDLIGGMLQQSLNCSARGGLQIAAARPPLHSFPHWGKAGMGAERWQGVRRRRPPPQPSHSGGGGIRCACRASSPIRCFEILCTTRRPATHSRNCHLTGTRPDGAAATGAQVASSSSSSNALSPVLSGMPVLLSDVNG